MKKNFFFNKYIFLYFTKIFIFVILRYIYGGKLPLEEYDTLDVTNILVAASELSLQELVIHIQSFLIKNEANWIEKNFNLIYQTSFEHDSFSELQKFYTDLISKEPEKIFKLVDFVSVPEKSLISLIQNDNLSMSDVQVWEHVLKWGIAQNPELSPDPFNYTDDDFNTLKNTIQQCIPFIRFYNLTSKEFSDKVLPYKKSLPKELFKELLTHFLDPDKKSSNKTEYQMIGSRRIDSKIITKKHAELISRWINKLDIYKNKRNYSHEFRLLFRGSRDGFTPKKFHEICDNKYHTITIAKVNNSNEILGGYNPVVWKSDSTYSISKDSFIFSFKGKDDVENHILSVIKNEVYAINNFSNFGPSFGRGDFKIIGINFYNYSFCEKCDYKEWIRETNDNFSVEEYEVFQISYIY